MEPIISERDLKNWDNMDYTGSRDDISSTEPKQPKTETNKADPESYEEHSYHQSTYEGSQGNSCRHDNDCRSKSRTGATSGLTKPAPTSATSVSHRSCKQYNGPR